ncbi:MAG TPA: glycosyltransferase, partial [Terriglobales bacterium]|nr:glycosyltransferase [Terriglobales bacterium]
LNRSLLLSLLGSHPDWHFVSAGAGVGSLANTHVLPWVTAETLAQYVQSLDVGFMPYDCYDEHNLFCVPLKMFECFAFGIPVVSTPLIHLWQYKDLIYFGETAEQLVSAVEAALNEPSDSPKRSARIEIARNHSIENLAITLRRCLPLDEVAPVDGRRFSIQLAHAS